MSLPPVKDKIPGGLSDKGPPKGIDPSQVEKGIKVEMEHTDDPQIAREITYDHLTEDPLYYDKLEKIEKKGTEEHTGVIRKEKGQYCVRSPNNPDWNGGCFDTKGEAEDRLRQVEFFKRQATDQEIAQRVAFFYQDRMARRVAARFMFSASLLDELIRRMDGLFANYTNKGSAEAAEWFKKNFRFDMSKTPQGQKDLKNKADKFHWFLRNAAGLEAYGKDDPDNDGGWVRGGKEAARIWEQEIKPQAGDLVRYFTDEGGKIVPREVQVGGNTYVNLVGFDQKKLGQYVTAMETVFDELKGWRKKALSGGIRVVLAGPKEFRGTSAGTYRSAEDALYVRATPHVLKRTKGTYGAFDYIIVHELGHRYDRKHGTKFDFERQEWWTTTYSRKDGEAFAELFALSNFGLSGSWDDVVSRFENLMTGHAEKPQESPQVLAAVRQALRGVG